MSDRGEAVATRIAGATVSLLFIGAFTLSYFIIAQRGDELTDIGGRNPFQYSSFFSLLFAILAVNIPAAATLFTGFISLGIGSVVATVLLGFYLGAVTAANVSVLGLVPTIFAAIWYAPLEFCGLLLSALAGIRPTVAALVVRQKEKSFLHLYLQATVTSLRFLILSIILIILGALLETTMILYFPR